MSLSLSILKNVVPLHCQIQNTKDMVTAVKTQSSATAKPQRKQIASVPEPKRLSKAGQWMLDNPHGIFEVRDWKAVNR